MRIADRPLKTWERLVCRAISLGLLITLAVVFGGQLLKDAGVIR